MISGLGSSGGIAENGTGVLQEPATEKNDDLFGRPETSRRLLLDFFGSFGLGERHVQGNASDNRLPRFVL